MAVANRIQEQVPVNPRKSKESESFDSVYRFVWSASLGDPPERQHPEILKFLAKHRALAEQDLEGGNAAAADSRLAVVLHSIIRTTQFDELRDALFLELARTGPFGRILAAQRIVAGMYEPKALDKLISDLPPDLLIGMLDEVVLRSEGREDIRDWAISFLDVLAGKDAEAAALHLSRSLNDMRSPSYALERAMLEGAYGKKLLSVLEKPASMWELAEYAQNASILPSAPLAEPLRYHIESCPPELIPPLVEAMTRHAKATPQLAKAMVNRLSHKDERVRVAALDGLLALAPPNIGPLLAKVHAKLVGLRNVLLTRLVLLPRADFNAFLKLVPEDDRPEILYRLFHILSRLDPENLKRVLRQTLRQLGRKRPSQKTVMVLEDMLPNPELPSPARPEPPAQGADLAVDKNAKDSGRLLGGLFGKPDKKAAAQNGQQEQALKIVKSQIKRADYRARILKDAEFTDSEIDGANMERAYFENAVFTGCAIRRVNFQQAAFVDCRFIRCSFESCDLGGSRWHCCKFSDVTFSCCSMDHCQMHHNEWRQAKLEYSSLYEAALTSQDMVATRFSNVDCTEASLNRVEAVGLELAGCLLDRALLYRCGLDNVTTWALRVRSCGASGLETCHPGLKEIEKHSLRHRIDTAAMDAEHHDPAESADPPPAPPAAKRLAGETVLRWYAARDLECKLSRFLANNIRREEWCKQKLGQRKWKLYKVIPLLLASEAFDKAAGLYPSAPPCRISGYAPDYTTVRIAQEIFPDETDWLAPSEEAVTIDALFTIGSVGTVAQNEASDLDYWVCANLSDLAEADREGLASKLEMLTDWAMEQFDLEAYFFLMDNEDVRNNNFGFSDKESSGSAQAMMLKEEFYRTAVLSAGKYPAWWFAPPGAGAKVYQRIAAQAEMLMGEGRMVDLGRPASIPPEEFFGAALWQIVKGLKSPFKSIMKFGLLERYTMGCEGGDALLCDRIKRNLHTGAESLWDIDPYVIMFREILEHYERAKDLESSRLAALSFHLKARLHEAAAQARRRPANRREKDLLELFSRTTGAGRDSTTAALAASDLTFEQLAALGERVNQFMTRTYTRVRQSQAEGAKLAITPEDMTKLGRKIFATFSRRQHKVERTPFLKLKKGFFSQMHVGVQHGRKGRIWEINAGQMDEAHGRVRISHLRKGPEIIQLLAWVTANKLFHPDMQLKMDLQAAPLTPQDVKELLTALSAFFPDKETFETDIDENLRAERITRAFFALNLMAPRDADVLQEVNLVYSTNWGELFCRAMPADDEVIAVDPHQYLKTHLDIEAPTSPAMELYIPNRSMCPGILLI